MDRFAAIIPAAGLSSRMGHFKPLLPLGRKTLLSRCVHLFRDNGIAKVFVVTGNRAEETSAAAEQYGAEPVHNPDFERGMYSSMLTGINALPEDIEAFLVLPVDIPLLRPETVGRLVREYRQTEPEILYPRFRGERGHPPVISASMIPAILGHNGAGGLRAVLDDHEAGARDLDVADRGTVHDLDRECDYTLACGLADTRYPSAAECEQLWDMYSLSPEIRAHCRAVARVAEAMCYFLNRQERKTRKLCTDLVVGAALTHDLAKESPQHEAEAAFRLRSHGFHAAADIVETHSDLELESGYPITETAVVFLADKLVQGDEVVTLEERYKAKQNRFGHKSDAKKAIAARLGRARIVCARIGREMGISPETLARRVLA